MPSSLAIASSSIKRLLKEESTYRTELASQELRIKKLQTGDPSQDEDVSNRDFQLRQEVFSNHFLCFPYVYLRLYSLWCLVVLEMYFTFR